MDWSLQEVTTIVEAYFAMLKYELADEPYNKTEYRKSLLPLLNNRSEGAIERKHQNITAVLMEMGQPFIKGYKRLGNYQQLLVTVVADYLRNHQPLIEYEFEKFALKTGTIKENEKINFLHFRSDEPVVSKISEPAILFRPIKTNYLEREQNNINLGEAGEKLIIDYEQWRLMQANKPELAAKIEWVSKEKGDGAGFDILSKNTDGSDRYIEVKTTKLSKETPIYLTANEMRFSESKETSFYLYRLYNFNSNPKFFLRNGAYSRFSVLVPDTYKAFFY